MKKILFLLVLIPSVCTARVIEIRSEEQLRTELEKEQPKVIDFYAPWCAPCKMMKPHYEALSEENTDVAFLSVDADTFKKIGSMYNIKSYPTIVFLDRSNSEKGRLEGAGDEKVLRLEFAGELSKIRGSSAAKKRPAQPMMSPSPAKKTKTTSSQTVRTQANKKSGLLIIKTPEEFLKVVKSPLPIFIHFYMASCETCLDIEDTFNSIAQDFEGKALFVRINASNDALPGITGKPGIIALPSYKWLVTKNDMHSWSKKDREHITQEIQNIIKTKRSFL